MNNNKAKISALEFEKKVFDREDVVIVLRCNSSHKVEDYDYDRMVAGTASVTNWLENRVKPRIDDIECVVLNGNLDIPHGRTKMARLRETYE